MKKNIVLAVGALVVIGLAILSIQRSVKNNEKKPSGMPTRAYVNLKTEDMSQPAREDIEAHRRDVELLFEEREKTPLHERQKLKFHDKAVVANDLLQVAKPYYHQCIVQNYLDTTSDSPTVQTQCVPFLTACSDGYSGDGKQADQATVQSKIARDAGSSDPIANLFLIRYSDKNDVDSMKAYQDLASQIKTPKISRFIQAYHAHLLQDLSMKVGTPFVQAECRYSAIDAFVSYLEEDSSEANLRLPWGDFYRFFAKLPIEEQRQCLMAIWQNGKIAPWMTHLAAGLYFHAFAWDQRGTEFASEVSESQWSDFKKYDKLAEDHLLRAWQIAPQHPEPATVMIRLAMAGNATRWTTRDWFCEAIRAQFDHSGAYHAYLFSMSPRWGGSYEELLAFAQEAMATQRYDTIVPGTYLTVVFENMMGETGDLTRLAKNPVVASTAKQFADALSAAVDKGVDAPANNLVAWGNLVRVLAMSGDFESARAIYVNHGKGQLGTSPLGFQGLKASYVRGLTFAATGAAKDDVAAFEDILNNSREDDYDLEALNDIQGVLEQTRIDDTQPEAQPYYNDVEAVVKQLQAYHSDQWVDLKFEQGLPGWYAHATHMDFKENGFFEVKSSDDSWGIQLTPMAHFRPPFLCEAELPEFVEGQDGKRRLALIYGVPSTKALYSDQKALALFMLPRSSGVQILDGNEPKKYQHMGWVFPKAESHRLRLIVWLDRVELYVDGKFVHMMPMEEGARGDQFTIGEVMPVQASNLMQVRNVRIRRLRMTPLPLNGENQPQIAIDYYRKMIEIDPQCPTFWYQAGFMHLKAAQNVEAVECFSKAFELDPKLNLTRLRYAEALVAVKRIPEAVEQYQIVLKSDDTNVEANTELALIYATSPDDKIRNGKESLRLASIACDRTDRKNWRPLCALALAHAELGQLEDAKKCLTESLAVAPEAPKEYRDYLFGVEKEFQAGKPIRIQDEADRVESVPASSEPSPK